ncbi:cell division protein FtsA [Neorickettsia findlayensis]|uniref:Cell division protein FtsA n=1 Tax=Neorickettsia findlayensis TaxID=2686014 RepID=A0A6P1G9N2_9RICK|nr:cell division protein FtsA [Neorickettsia findlayensis]QHD65167.1 cell division protein FtsA [Neorickettsia findlayensis]
MEIRLQSLHDGARFTILDLGSDRLKCATFKFTNSGELDLVGAAEVPTVGIRGGAVINIEKAKRSITDVLEAAERVSDEAIDGVYVITSDTSIAGRHYGEKIEIKDKKISVADVELIKKKIADRVSTPIIHMSQQECFIDGVQSVSNPVGMYGRCLSASFYVVSGIKTMMLNLENLISQCNLRFLGCSFAPYSGGYSVLSNDEKEVGALVVDMGAVSTTSAVFKDGRVCHVAGVPIGGSHVSKDIAFGLNIGVSSADLLKKDRAALFLDKNNENNRVDLSLFSDVSHLKEISMREIADMVIPRLEETFELLNEKVKDVNFSTVVLTGGGSKIGNIKHIAEKVFSKKVRTHGNTKARNTHYGPEYSAIFGLATMILDLRKEALEKKSVGYIRRILNAVYIKGD